MDDLIELQNAMRPLDKAEREALCKRLGVAKSTGQKIAFGHIRNPGYYTVRPLLKHFRIGPFKKSRK